MEYRELGHTGLMVSRLCFGTLTLGPLQANLSIDEGSRLLQAAFSFGINFLDTAVSYQNYPLLRRALQGEWGDKVIIASKSYDYTAAGMAASLERTRQELNRDYVDIWLLHEQESALTLRGHQPALEYLWEAKAKGLVRAVGLSTHHVAGVKAAAESELIEVVHPLFNKAGIGINDGTREDMLSAIRAASAKGKGVYAMKALAGGHLWQEAEAALNYVLSLDEIASVAVGMQTLAEVQANSKLFAGQPFSDEVRAKLGGRQRRLHIEDWCEGCALCQAACPAAALHLQEGRMTVDAARCVMCAYCAPKCPHFCLKVI